MPDIAYVLGLAAGIGFVIFGAARVGGDASMVLTGIFAPSERPDWPHGVQESDAPHFAVDHLDELRPGTPARLDPASPPGDDPPPAEMVELWSRHLLAP